MRSELIILSIIAVLCLLLSLIPKGKLNRSPGQLKPSNIIPSFNVPLQCFIISVCVMPKDFRKLELLGTRASPTPIGLFSSGYIHVISLLG